jgi:hypothetical protein
VTRRGEVHVTGQTMRLAISPKVRSSIDALPVFRALLTNVNLSLALEYDEREKRRRERESLSLDADSQQSEGLHLP